MEKYSCDECGRQLALKDVKTLYDDDGGYCDICFNGKVSYAEYIYDSLKEEEA